VKPASTRRAAHRGARVTTRSRRDYCQRRLQDGRVAVGNVIEEINNCDVIATLTTARLLLLLLGGGYCYSTMNERVITSLQLLHAPRPRH